MVSHNPQDGHPPFKIYKKEVYYRLEIWHLNFTYKIKTRWSADGQLHHKDGYPPSKGGHPPSENLPEGSVLQTWNLVHKHNSKN